MLTLSFSWAESIGVTDIEFFNSTAFGPSYENGIFVGDITTGTLFYFEPNVNRTGINLESDPLLSDLIVDSDDETSAVTFGTGFKGLYYISRDEPFPDLCENADFSIDTIKASIRQGELKLSKY